MVEWTDIVRDVNISLGFINTVATANINDQYWFTVGCSRNSNAVFFVLNSSLWFHHVPLAGYRRPGDRLVTVIYKVLNHHDTFKIRFYTLPTEWQGIDIFNSIVYGFRNYQKPLCTAKSKSYRFHHCPPLWKIEWQIEWQIEY